MDAEDEEESPSCCDPTTNDDVDVKGTLIDNAKLSGCVNDERTRNDPYGSCWCSGDVANKTSLTISL